MTTKAPRLSRERPAPGCLGVAELVQDLRAPLRAIDLSVESLLEVRDLPSDALVAVTRLASAAQEVAELSHRLAAMTRREPPQRGLTLQRVELTTLCRRAVELARATHAGRRIAVDAPRPIVGRWDPRKLLQVVQNLVGAALVRGPGPVELEAWEEGERARLRARSGGPDPRGRERATEVLEGGAAFPIVARAARAQGGSASAYREGSAVVFEVSLPRTGGVDAG